MLNRLIVLFCTLLALAAANAHAGYDEDLAAIQQRWATIRYEMKGDEQKKQLEKLIVDADQFAQKNPDKAEAYIWVGVARGSLAEAINGIGALGIVKEAKASLEKALSIDPSAGGGYAYGVLGLIYQKVPGWPIGFGDKKKAKELLLKGLEVDPNGMNNNYFYAQFLYEDGEAKKALPYIERAAQAPPPSPPEKSLAVSNRQREIRELAEKIKAKQ